jgi:hypothetical protein
MREAVGCVDEERSGCLVVLTEEEAKNGSPLFPVRNPSPGGAADAATAASRESAKAARGNTPMQAWHLAAAVGPDLASGAGGFFLYRSRSLSRSRSRSLSLRATPFGGERGKRKKARGKRTRKIKIKIKIKRTRTRTRTIKGARRDKEERGKKPGAGTCFWRGRRFCWARHSS